MDGANGVGFQDSFKVYPVQMVAGVPKPRREQGGSRHQESRSSRPSTAGIMLRQTAEADCPQECYTVTYDRHSRLQTYSYQQSREYTF